MHIIPDNKLDFNSVLLRPKRSTLNSRKEVDLNRTFKFKNSGNTWTGVPIMSANMDTTGTMEMQRELAKHNVITCLHKHYSTDELVKFFTAPQTNTEYVAYSMGIVQRDVSKWQDFYGKVPKGSVKFLCIDVANGYTQRFSDLVSNFHKTYPEITIIAGNVVTGEMTEELILRGADIIKVGIGPGFCMYYSHTNRHRYAPAIRNYGVCGCCSRLRRFSMWRWRLCLPRRCSQSFCRGS